MSHCAQQKNKTGTNSETVRVSALNDALRQSLRGGMVVVTDGVLNLGCEAVDCVIQQIRQFDEFTDDNDPYGEHDFGALSAASQKIFWKIDYYDQALEFASPDPADPSVTSRVLTIMLASEY